jgi:hypothetical protein
LLLAFAVVNLQVLGIRFPNSERKGFLFYVLWAEGLLGLKLEGMHVVGDNPKKVSVGDMGKEVTLLTPGILLCLRNQFQNHACPRKGNICFTECGVFRA